MERSIFACEFVYSIEGETVIFCQVLSLGIESGHENQPNKFSRNYWNEVTCFDVSSIFIVHSGV